MLKHSQNLISLLKQYQQFSQGIKLSLEGFYNFYSNFDDIELFSFMVFGWFVEALMGCRWIKALLGVVVALEVHEE